MMGVLAAAKLAKGMPTQTAISMAATTREKNDFCIAKIV